MYHCHMYFYYIGDHQQLLETIKQLEPAEQFTYTSAAWTQRRRPGWRGRKSRGPS